MHTRPTAAVPLAWLAGLVVAVLVVHLPGLGNPLFFDDEYLLSGELFRDYDTLRLKERFLSYGSFVWVQAVFGEGWWKQRLVNLLLHLCVTSALWGFYRELLKSVAPRAPEGVAPGEHAGDASLTLWVSVGFFALNPVAVYAVGYLIQRSILLATLFTVLALWSAARALGSGRPAWLLAAAACYVLAVASKEHAVLAPLVALPLAVLVARPTPRRLLVVAAVVMAAGAAAAIALTWRYGHVIGKPFDELSAVYLAQLAALSPQAAEQAWPLSVMNQAYLFFEYGARWALPWSGWMSINLRPAFPVSFSTLPQALGPIAYLACLALGAFLVLRFRDGRALLGLCLLMPALLFCTEFATVWVQDPFVLYRSYLWAIGLPGIAYLLLRGLSGRALAAVAIGGAGLLGWQAIDRAQSMSTPERVYSDAIAKLSDDPRAVGRWFPYLNRGNAYFDAGQYQLAERDFRASAELGDAGLGTFNIGNLRLREGDPEAALSAFADAARQGYTGFNLTMQRGAALAALGRNQEAYGAFQSALAMNPTAPARRAILLQMGRVALALGRAGEAIGHAREVLSTDKRNRQAGYILATALVATGDFPSAVRLLNIMIAESPEAALYYTRAMAHAALDRKPAAKADIEEALRLGLDNPVLRDWQQRIEAMP